MNGTIGILQSCKKYAPNVKRVVVTSSVACILNTDLKPPHRFDETDWNPISVPICEKLGRAADGANKYRGEWVKRGV